MHNLCVKLAGYLATRTGQPERAAVLAYGLELMLGEVFKLTVLFIVAALLDIFPITFLVTVSTISLRLVSGGKHCTSHFHCFFATLAVFLTLGWLARIFVPWFSGPWLPWILIIAFIYLVTAIYLWVPLSNEHRKLDTPEKKKTLRRLSLFLVTGWFFSGILLMIFLKEKPFAGIYLTGITTGLLFQGLSVSPLGVKVTDGFGALAKAVLKTRR